MDDATARWVDFSGEMRATTREPGWMDYAVWMLSGIGFVVLILVAALIVLAARIRRKPAVGAAPARSAIQSAPTAPRLALRPCPQCGARIPSHATFCPLCGARQP